KLVREVSLTKLSVCFRSSFAEAGQGSIAYKTKRMLSK
ncbi:hypothetical protein M2444_005280, partial [Paenibacillus sp. PastF-3]|nr:hypothetical protein [Paenibacillus sp. PastF-3]